MKSKKQMLAELEVMLRDVFTARHEGALNPKIAHAQGCVDGYMKAMLAMGIVDDRELLAVVARQRKAVSGPATGEMGISPAVVAA